MSKKDANPCLIRWIILLQEYDIEVRDRKRAVNGVTDHLSRMRVDKPIPLDDSLSEENVYVIEGVPIEGVPALPQQRVARFKSYDTLWFRHYANYLATYVVPLQFFGYKKKKFLLEVKRYHLDEPYLYKKCSDNLFRRCIPKEEVERFLHGCHGSYYAGHFATFKTVFKVLQAGFWWPTMFKDAHAFISRCDACQKMGIKHKQKE